MKKIFYGWWVAIASFLTLFVCIGIGFFSLPVFLKPIAEDTLWGVDRVSVAGAISALAAGFATPAVGYVVDRFGARAPMLPGVALVAASYVLLARITSVGQMYILFLVSGIGMALATIIPTQTLVSRWFHRKRGRVMGFVTVGGGLGGMVWMPIVNRLIENLGWRGAYQVLGIIIAVVSIPIIVFVIRSTPASMGLSADGEDEAVDEGEEAGPVEESGYDLPTTLRTRSFWLIFCASFFGVFAGTGFGLHVITFLSESGLTLGKATIAWSATIGVSIVGHFLFGLISEKYQKRFFASAANFVRMVSIVNLVLFALGVIPLGAAIAQLAILYGLFVGCNAVMSPLLLAETFGVKAFGKIMGMLGIPFTIGMALGQIAGGYLRGHYGNYNVAFAVFAFGLLISGVAIGLAKPLFLLEGRVAPVEESA